MTMRGECASSANNGASFANGNGPGSRIWPSYADWLAGIPDARLLSHWAVMP